MRCFAKPVGPYALDGAGPKSDADRELAIVEKNMRRGRPLSSRGFMPAAKTLIGRFDWLDRAYRQRDPALITLTSSPCPKILVSDPRYKALRSKMKLPE